MYNKAKKLYNKLLSIYYDDYNDITDDEKEKIGEKYSPKNLLSKGQRFIEDEKLRRVKLRRQKADDSDKFTTTRR